MSGVSVIEFETHVSLITNPNFHAGLEHAACTSSSQPMIGIQVYIYFSSKQSFPHLFSHPPLQLLPLPQSKHQLLVFIQTPISHQASNMESVNNDDDASDSDDMSPGARLMRYNISDGPRLDFRSFDFEPRCRSSTTIPPGQVTSAPFVWQNQQDSIRGAIRSATTSACTIDTDSNIGAKDLIGGYLSYPNRFSGNPSLFHGNLAEAEGHLLDNVIVRQSNREIMVRISTFCPQAPLSSKTRTRRIANVLKNRLRGTSKLECVPTIHATWTVTQAVSKPLQHPLPGLMKYWNSKTRTVTRSMPVTFTFFDSSQCLYVMTGQ